MKLDFQAGRFDKAEVSKLAHGLYPQGAFAWQARRWNCPADNYLKRFPRGRPCAGACGIKEFWRTFIPIYAMSDNWKNPLASPVSVTQRSKAAEYTARLPGLHRIDIDQ
ncbi:MAG: hypothetical protein ABR924_16870 [Terracidiphilus sp.]|jgi:hypothetical protein